MSDGGKLRRRGGPTGFAQVPRHLLRNANVTSLAIRVWALLWDMYSDGSPNPFPGQKRLAEWSGAGERTVRDAIACLVEHGYLDVHRRGQGKTNMYTVIWDPSAVSLGETGSDRQDLPVRASDRQILPVKSGRSRRSRVAGSAAKAEPGEAEPEEAAGRNVSSSSRARVLDESSEKTVSSADGAAESDARVDDDDGAAADDDDTLEPDAVTAPPEPLGGDDGPVESLIRDLTKRAPTGAMRRRLRAALNRGWTVGEINQRLQHAAAANNRQAYITETLTELASGPPSWVPPEGGWAGEEEQGAVTAGPVSRSGGGPVSESRRPETMSPEQPYDPQEALEAEFAERYPGYRPKRSNPEPEPEPEPEEPGPEPGPEPEPPARQAKPRVVPVREGLQERTPVEAEAEVRRMMADRERDRRVARSLDPGDDLGGGR